MGARWIAGSRRIAGSRGVRYVGRMSTKRDPHPDDAGPLKLVVPGLGGSGPTHWQSLWADGRPGWSRVEQRSWDAPDPDAWCAALDEAVRGAGRPVVLVAHSLACVLVARWASRAPRGSVQRIAAALLVAPADVDRPDGLAVLRPFAPAPAARLPFPSWVVASTDDPYCTFGRAAELATAWGAQVRSVGASGHVNVASGHGPWPEGERILAEVLAGASVQRRDATAAPSAA